MTTYKSSFPLKSFYLLLGAFVSAAVFVVVSGLIMKHAASGDMSLIDAVGDFAEKADPRALVIYGLSLVLAIMMAWAGRDLFSFMAGQRPELSMSEHSFTLNGSTHGYADIRGVLYDYADKRLQIALTNGTRLIIRERLYKDFFDIQEQFLAYTVAPLTASVLDQLHRGETVKFGEKAKLSLVELGIGNRSFSTESIEKARLFTGNENGGEYECLTIQLPDKKKVELQTCFIENLYVLINTLEAICPNLKVGI